jgi:membrane protease YdiL (CAAX protease family)
MLELKLALAYWAVTIVSYTAILGLSGQYEISSNFYHVLLLSLPIYLLLRKRGDLGLKKGNAQVGGIFCSAFILMVLIKVRIFSFPSDFLSSVILAPLSEEIYHRGYMQPLFRKRGILITSFLFATIHLPKLILTGMLSPLDLALFFILGIFWGYARKESGSVIYPIFCHAAWNYIAILK